MEITVYEMKYDKETVPAGHMLSCIPFEKQFFQEYMSIYNECFYEMRKALGIEPYNYLHDYAQMQEKEKDTYLLLENGEILGAVACYGNEVDDLIVNKKFQQKGYGKELLLWGMQYIRKKNHEPIVLYVAEWNQNAIAMYKNVGFEIEKIVKVNRHV